MSTAVYLLEVDAWTGAAVQTLRYATHTIATRPGDSPANVVYDGRISDPGSMTRSIYQAGAILGAPSDSLGYIELNNADGALDPLYGYGWGRAFTLRELSSRDSSVAGAATVFRGVVVGVASDNARQTVKLRLRDRLAGLNVALLTNRYAGTTTGPGATAEGGPAEAGQVKRRIFGSVTNVEAKLVNPFNLLYQVSDVVAGYAPTSIVAYDGGLALDLAGDYPTLDGLIGAPLVGSQYATCLAQGILRPAQQPARVLTCDVVEGATLSDRCAARVVQRMLYAFGLTSADLDAASFNTFAALFPAEVGILVEGGTTAAQAAASVMGSFGAVLPSRLGVFQAVPAMAPAATAAATFNLRSVGDQAVGFTLNAGASQQGDGVPIWSLVLNWGKVWRVMTAGDLLGSVTADRAAYLTTETRQATARDAAVLTANPLSPETTLDTLIAFQTDANIETARRLAMHKVRRDRMSVPVSFDDIGSVEIGQTVAVDIPRFSYAGGKLFFVAGRGDDFKTRVATLELWG